MKKPPPARLAGSGARQPAPARTAALQAPAARARAIRRWGARPGLAAASGQIQHYEARWWRDACLQYFGSVSRHTIPSGYAAPAHDLPFYQTLQTRCPADATKPRCPDIYTGNPSPAILN